MQDHHFIYTTPKASQITDAISLLKKAAQRLQSQNIKQWSYWLDPPAERLEWLQEGFEKGQFTFVYKDEKLIATYRLMDVDLKYWGKKEESAYYIHSLVVDPDFKGQKIGSHLIHRIFQKALIAKKQFLRLDCDATNDGLCQYYERLGFEKVGQVQMELSLNALFERPVLNKK
ncbi:hypothetical protein AAU57_07455 [Nonlabens sp. YIK11]|uniref:GNAT family N-acetyltransferase n=1 Tax=Nonlabens sp. YIK11 TaxID=1453349 RepID=UPI0006DC64D7|nr:GNAT family N-acetyltransferase [Nonlabens sp. YIK11]KQC33166.1 hypothetical protein AAU57_07455 [Nonlabens sp. YIK11]